ncbi:MAG: ZinT/AdcA family metal-binding protein [Treponema sp.]
MLAKKHIKYSAAVLALCTVFFAGCTSTSSAMKTGGDMKAQAGKELAAWKGEWQSFSAVTDSAELNDVYKKAAEGLQFYTEDGIKAVVANMLATPVIRAKFDGSNTVLFTVVDADGNEKQVSCEYRYAGDVPVLGYEDKGLTWKTFEAVKAVRGLSQARYMIAFPPHQDSEGGLQHWHARFGGKDIKSLVNADPLWWPTFVDASFTKEDLLKAVSSTVNAVAKGMIPAESLAAYKGKWINNSLIYDDDRPAVQNVYKKLIKEFAGKNNGGDFTKADIIAMAKKTYGTAADFTHLEFITADDKNEMVIWKDMTEVARITYKRDGANPLRSTANAFTATDLQKAGKFAYLVMTNPHGSPLHMHAWYGMNPDEIDKVEGKPTCIPADSTEAEIAARVENTCRKFLQGAAK